MPIYDMLSGPYFNQIINSQVENILSRLTAKQFVIFPSRAQPREEKNCLQISTPSSGGILWKYAAILWQGLWGVNCESHAKALVWGRPPHFLHEMTLVYLSVALLIPCGGTKYQSCFKTHLSKRGDSGHKAGCPDFHFRLANYCSWKRLFRKLRGQALTSLALSLLLEVI